MTAVNPPLPIRAGASVRLRFPVLDEDNANAPLDLTPFTGRWTLAVKNGDGSFQTPLVTKTGGSVTLVAGVVTVTLLTADTKDLRPGEYHYQLNLIDAGLEKFPVAIGRVTIEPSIE
jgi:hypothetical protein